METFFPLEQLKRRQKEKWRNGKVDAEKKRKRKEERKEVKNEMRQRERVSGRSSSFTPYYNCVKSFLFLSSYAYI